MSHPIAGESADLHLERISGPARGGKPWGRSHSSVSRDWSPPPKKEALVFWGVVEWMLQFDLIKHVVTNA